MTCNCLKRSSWHVGGICPGCFYDQPCCRECLHHLLNQSCRYAQILSHLRDTWRRFATQKSLPDAGHQSQRDKLTASLIDVLQLSLLQIRGPILECIRHLRAEQQNEPGKINADHKYRHQAEAPVNLAV